MDRERWTGFHFGRGEVEVIMLQREPKERLIDRYALRGTPVRYIDPLGNAAEGDWEGSS